MVNKKFVKTTIFFIIGVLLFWYVYQNMDFLTIKEVLTKLKYRWIFLSLLLGLLSNLIRALRWKMLIEPLGYKPRIVNLLISVQVLYFFNLVIPRGGELARCGMVAKYEKIPFVKLVGTVFIERLTDLIAFFIIFLGVFFWQITLIREMLNSLNIDFSNFQSKSLILVSLIIAIILLYLIFKRTSLFKKFQLTINNVAKDIKEGLKSILLIKNKWAYLFQTFLIYLIWILMLYVVFFAYSPTRNMTFSVAIFTYTIGTFAYLLPIQAGIGVWHFLVIQCLFLFGLDKDSGMMLALIAHTFTNLFYLILGTIGFIIIPLINNNDVEKRKLQKNKMDYTKE